MRMSALLVRTLRDAPADAEAASHQLLVRAGYIRRLASGVYTFLPLGFRVLKRIEQIITEELDAAGAQQMLMPVLHPIELWQESGRASLFGSDALPAMTADARGGTFVLGPTHEEVVTATVAAEVDSYRQLPQTVYQIQVKLRDEARPRYGLMRTRELIMADAYSFDVDRDALAVTYASMVDAYLRIFARIGLDAVPVEASSGAIGGDVNHEFMVPSPVGEDEFVQCGECGYAANVEAATRMVDTGAAPAPPADMAPPELHATPGRPGIDAVAEFFADRGIGVADLLKCLAVVDGAGEPALLLLPGDREARLPAGWRMFDDGDFASSPTLVKGYLGPDAGGGIRVVADRAVGRPGSWVSGANRTDHHRSGLVLDRDFTVDEWGDFVLVTAGDACPRCGHALRVVRSVEAAHTFQLGTKYSAVMRGATFAGEDGAERQFVMGCYGIGVSRLVAVVAEAFHDERGLRWPASVAPFDVHVVPLAPTRSPEALEVAERLVAGLEARGTAVLLDDRSLSPGVSLADAELIGIPVRVVVGAKSLARGVVEVTADGTTRDVPVDSAIDELLSYTGTLTSDDAVG